MTIDSSLGFHEGLPSLLVGEGWDVNVVSGPGMNLHCLTGASGVVTHELEMPRDPSPWADFRAFLKWFSLLREVRPDVVMIGTPKASLLGLAAAKVLRVRRRIYVLHGLRLETTKGLFRKILLFFERLTCWAATDILSVSPSLRSVALGLRLMNPDKIRVLGWGSSNGILIERFEPQAEDASLSILRTEIGVDVNLPVIGFMGRVTADKGLGHLANALTVMAARGEMVQVLIVGAYDGPESHSLMSELITTGHPVIHVGHVSDVAPYFKLMDVFCLPSRREGLGLVVLEAMASRIPVVATRATGLIDLVLDGVTGRLVEQDDDIELADALSTTILGASDEASNAMIEAAHQKVLKHFPRHLVQRHLLDYLNSSSNRSTP